MGIKVFIADDEPLIRMDLEEILKEAGYDVVGHASDGFETIEGVKNQQPDIVFLDIKMPILNGLKTAELLKKDGYRGCIIMLTAYSSDDFIDQANKAGAMGYFIKPLDERNFIPNLKIMYSRSKDIDSFKNEVIDIKLKLEERKKIEKAKGIIMDSKKISEEEAYSYIRKLSMSKRVSLVRISEIIILSEGILC